MTVYPDSRRKPFFLAWGFAVLLLISGCTAVNKGPVQKQWSCDVEADAAVERQEWEFALARHQALLEASPQNCLAIYHLGYILGKIGQREEETVQYENAVQCGLNDDDRLYFNLGMAYGEMNQIEKALSAFEQAVRLNDRNAENYFGLGLIAQADGQSERAEAALIKTVDLDPRHWEARLILARIYLDRGHMEAAHRHLKHLTDNIPENAEVEELRQIYEERRITSFEQ